MDGRCCFTRFRRRLVVFLILPLAHLATVGAEHSRQTSNDCPQATCEIAYYVRESAGGRFIDPNSDRTDFSAVGGAVLKIIEPEEFAGQFIGFHFDGPPGEHYTSVYEPGLLYRGPIRTNHICKHLENIPMMCDQGWLLETKLARPLARNTPQEFRKLIQDRHWNKTFINAIRDQFGERELFNILYGFLADTNRSGGSFTHQQRAARLLLEYQPSCEISLRAAIRDTLSSCDEYVSEWPRYLGKCFGRETFVRELDELEKEKLSQNEREKIEMWRWWLRTDEKLARAPSIK